MPGTVAVSVYNQAVDGSRMTIKLACVGDHSDGTVPDTEIPLTICQNITGVPYTKAGYSLSNVRVVDDSVTPPDAADITITDELGFELYTEVGIIPTGDTKWGTLSASYPVESKLTVSVANQATIDAIWSILITLSGNMIPK